MSLRKELIRSSIGVGVMRLVAIAFGLATSILLARTLGSESFGQYSFAMALVTLLAIPVAGGVPQLLIREVAGCVHSGQWSLYRGVVRGANFWVLAISMILLSLVLVFGYFGNFLPNSGKWALVFVATLLIPIKGFNAVRNGITKGLGFPAYAEFPTQIIQPLLLLIAFFTLSMAGLLSATSAVWTQICCGTITFVIASILFLKISPKCFIALQPRYEIKKWGSSLLPFTLIAIVGTFNTQVGVVLLGLLGTDEAVAVLRIGERGAQFIALPLSLVNMVIAPQIVKIYRSGDMQRLQHLSRKSARGAFLLSLPIACAFFFFGVPLIALTFGNEYSNAAYVPIIVLSAGQLVNVLCGSVGYLLSMSGNEHVILRSQILSLIVNVIACTILIPLYGATGAAIGVAISIVLWNLLLGFLVYKKLEIFPGIF